MSEQKQEEEEDSEEEVEEAEEGVMWSYLAVYPPQ